MNREDAERKLAAIATVTKEARTVADRLSLRDVVIRIIEGEK